jgi:hypothetical protein
MVIMAMCKKDALERFLVIPKPCFNSLSPTTIYQPDILTILFVKNIGTRVLVIVNDLVDVEH